MRTKIILFSKNNNRYDCLKNVLSSFDVENFSSEQNLFDYLKNNSADAVILDTVNLQDSLNICRAIKFTTQLNNVAVIQIVDNSAKNKEFLKYSSYFVSEPIDSEVLLATINSALLARNSIKELSENNTELSTKLYSLNVLNNIVTELSGSLDKTEIIKIMTEGIEKSLSFQLCYSLAFNDPTDITLVINSVYNISSRLEEAIKVRAMLSYKNLFNIHAKKEAIKVVKNIKRKDFEFDLNVFHFDTVFAPINIKNKFFGIIEVFKEKEIKEDDTIFFQTLVKQAVFPLQSAVLYEEIKEQNLKLEEMEKKKSEFFSIVSHELRTPLTAIQNAVKILLSNAFATIMPDKAISFIKMIERNSERLLSIVQEWLDSVKAEAGKLDYNFTVSGINSLVDSVGQNLSNLAEGKNIELIIDKSEDLPALYIDTKRIEQVITNLVSNALKYTPNGGTITISTEIMEDMIIKEKPFSNNKDRVIADEYVVIKVSDTGQGIEAEDIPKVFEKFEQVKGTLSRSVGGTGLGLFIAKKFAEVHNGFLWVESIINKGSDFYLAIPVLTEDERFEMQLHHDISNAESDKKDFGLITLCEKKIGEEPYLVEFVNKLNSENIFKKSTESKCFYTETKERLYYSFYDINMNKQIFNFVVQRIVDFAQNDDILQNGKKIYFSQAYYPDDAGDSEELIKKSKKLLKEVING